MSGLFATLNTSKGAMYAQQQSINITSHNIANAGTPGYSRQHGIQQTARPQTVTGAGQVGTGVVMNEIQRSRNIFLDFQIRKESSYKGQYDVREQYLTEVENIFNEPSDTGISKLISKFFDGWQVLSTNAEKSDARTIVAETAKALADEINLTYNKLNASKENSKREIEQSVTDINSILSQLNSIDKQIKTVTVAGNNPNDLMDSRDLLLDELSTKFGITVNNKEYNSKELYPEASEDIQLIDFKGDTEIYELTYSNDGAVKWIGNKGTDKGSFNPQSGALGGLISVSEDIEKQIGQLNLLAKAIAYSVNAVHKEGYEPKEKSIPFFVNTDNNNFDSNLLAANIKVNKEILENPMKIQTGESEKSGGIDGSRARIIAELRDLRIDITGILNDDGTYKSYDDFKNGEFDFSKGSIPKGNNDSTNIKIESYFKKIINELGIKSQEAQRIVKNQDSLLKGLTTRRASVSGVSMDEEMVNLVQFQHAYQANAKMISTVDELLDVVINGLKR